MNVAQKQNVSATGKIMQKDGTKAVYIWHLCQVVHVLYPLIFILWYYFCFW